MDGFYFSFIITFFLIVIVFLVVLLIYLFMQLRRSQTLFEREYQVRIERTIKTYEGRLRDLDMKHQGEIQKARQQSVATSRHTIKGQIAEQLAPLLPGFPYTPSDSHFIGDPIDYVVFKGYTDYRDKNVMSDEFEIVLLDIKHNKAVLTDGQKAIARAVEAGKVRFEVVRVMDDGSVEKKEWKGRKKAAE